jgi:hypothetical protein
MSEPEQGDERSAYRSLLDREAAPGLARLAAGAWWRTGVWTAHAAVDATRRVAGAARSGESASALVDDARREVARAGRRFLGIGEGRPDEAPGPDARDYDDQRLHEGWRRLMDLSTEIDVEVDGHPAFAGILSQLHPDEARILRLLASGGPQPAIDIRAGLPIASDLVKGGLNMIGAEAGLRYTDRVHAYLNNLNRLGLVWFSRERLRDPQSYQVLEAQPEVIEAMKKAGRTARTVRRSILLTPFGRDFCEMALPGDAGEYAAVVRLVA